MEALTRCETAFTVVVYSSAVPAGDDHMRHVRAFGLIVLTAGLLAAACGAVPPSAQPGPTTTLEVWLMKESAPDNVIAELNQQFHTLHPDVQVRLTTLDWPGRDEKWQAGMSPRRPRRTCWRWATATCWPSPAPTSWPT